MLPVSPGPRGYPARRRCALVGLCHVEHIDGFDARDLAVVNLVGGDDADALLALHHDAASGQPAVECANLGGVRAGGQDALLSSRVPSSVRGPCCQECSRLGGEPGVAGGLVPVDVEPAGHVGQQLGQLHGVPGATAAACLLEGVGAPLVGL